MVFQCPTYIGEVDSSMDVENGYRNDSWAAEETDFFASGGNCDPLLYCRLLQVTDAS